MPAIAPSLDQRLAARSPEAGSSAVMVQRWTDLLFLHWEIERDLVQDTLPAGLYVDTFEERTFVGVVPFFMDGVRPRLLPPVPGLSNFLELNLRTYVHDRHGVPGVWFYSLDANQGLAVALARRLFHLPYRHSRMSAGGSPLVYRCTPPGSPELTYTYERPGPGQEAEPGSLEFFLLERYYLYAHDQRRGRLLRGQVAHRPYRFERATVGQCAPGLFATNGLPEPAGPPCSQLASQGVAVSVYPLREAS